jgi:hypothetical protein
MGKARPGAGFGTPCVSSSAAGAIVKGRKRLQAREALKPVDLLSVTPPSVVSLLESLWQSYVYDLPLPKKESRSEAAIQALLAFKEIMTRSKEEEKRLNVFGHAIVVWNLLANEIGSWLLDALPLASDGLDSQSRLFELLSYQTPSGPPTHRHALGTVGLLVPRALAEELRASVTAFVSGETHNMLKEKPRRWTQNQMRRRALEHVWFLVGQKYTQEKAREIVGAAMGNVPAGTLREWEARPHGSMADLKWRRQSARAAGKLKLELECGSEADGPIDAHALHTMNILLKQNPLQRFGAEYKRIFGGRHWGARPA